MSHLMASVSSISHVFPPVLMRGPIVEHSISLVKAAIITGDTSGIIGLSNEKMQCVVDVIHEVGRPKSFQGPNHSSMQRLSLRIDVVVS